MLRSGNRRRFLFVAAAIAVALVAIGTQVVRAPVEQPGVVRVSTVDAATPGSAPQPMEPRRFVPTGAPTASSDAVDPDVEAHLVSIEEDDAAGSRQRMHERGEQGAGVPPQARGPDIPAATPSAASSAWGP